MHINTGFETFKKNYEEKKPQLVWYKMVADMDTPITASLKLMQGDAPFFLLESVEQGEKRGRYSIIGMEPDLVWKCDEKHAEISRDNQEFIGVEGEILDSFRAVFAESQLEIPEGLPPMASGLIGYMSYDAIRFIEKTVPDSNPDTIKVPVGLFMRPTIMVVFDSVTTSLFVVVSVRDLSGDAEDAYLSARSKIERIVTRLRSVNIAQHQAEDSGKKEIEFVSSHSPEEYCQMVNKAKEYIFAGDIFQVVPSQRFTAKFDMPPFAFYRSLRHMNPSPFLFFLNFGGFQLVGSSPEILVRLREGEVTIRPLAGTRKRGKNSQEDAELAADLLSDEKEISEHLMLIDLSRNDVGRVSKPGTVEVTEEMIIEYYSHVMHISSNVDGEIDPKYDALDALFAGLPVGTVSGAPKVRAMQIIDELENEKRSFYAGCVGYFSANGMMDTCITLRTGLIKDGELYIQAGGGIVADSEPEAEYQESCNKAKALMRAAEDTIRFVA
jgi:anthranilate synthase component I